MSRPTTAQIIEKGEYLDVDFDPMSLTIPQLLGLFQHHGIKYPSQHNKAKLVDLFNGEIKARSVKLKRQRVERNGIAASDDGILDGLTGQPLAPSEPGPVRRSTRRVSRESTIEILRPEPPKRRRSSAQPSLGRISGKRVVNGPPTVSEESEEEQAPEPPFKVGRGDANDVVSRSSTRRVSQKFGPGTEDSGWEDNNIFQSNVESSSPVRSPKTKRKSSRKSRVSMSAPPGIDSSPEGSRAKAPSQLRFEPDLPSSVRKTRLGAVPVKSEDDEEYLGDQSRLMDASAADISAALWVNDDDIDEDDVPINEYFGDKQTLEVAQRLAGDASVGVTQRRRSGRLWTWTRTIFLIVVFAFLAKFCYEYKLESEPIGYCDTGSNTNTYLENIRQQRLRESETRAVTPSNGRDLILAKISEVHPDSCTPCPAHGTCTRDTVVCNDGYIKRMSLFATLPYLEQFANGLPLLYPVAFPPTCVDDVIRKKNVNSIGRRIDGILAKTRGDRHCAGKGEVSAIDGGAARRWGMRIDELKDNLQKRPAGRREVRDTHPGPSLSEHEFDTLFAEALDQLTKLDKIIVSSDSNGYEYIASDREELSLTCQANVLLRESFAEWKKSIIGLLAFIATVFAIKAQVLARRAETQRVSELVQIALDTLRNLELAHHTDPVTTPHPYLSSLQLRDLVLQDEHSVPTRRRLWNRVEAIVESNANVRVNLEEIHGGDEARVWRWVGSSGAISPRKAQYPQMHSPGIGTVERVVA